MTVEEQFTSLVKEDNEKEILVLLKQASKTERKGLVPTIKKLTKHYNEYKDDGKGRYSAIGTETQQKMLMISSFVCFTRADFEKAFYSTWILDPKYLVLVRDWHIPDWFSDFVNKLADGEFFSNWISYDYIMELSDQGLVKPSRLLIAKLLPASIFEHVAKGERRYWVCKPENLLKRPASLQEHFWFLFEEETNLHFSDRYIHFGNEANKEEIGWVPVIKNFVQSGQLDKTRLLKESLLASNKNFNKVLSGWFAELFVQLEPTAEEIKKVQKELINVLNSAHSKPVSVGLQYLRKIATDKELDVASVLDAAPVILSSNTKNIVASSLMLLEQIAKSNKNKHTEITGLCCQVFIHRDDDLQTRAAKIIEKYGSFEDETLVEKLDGYRSEMLQNAKKILNAFVAVNEKVDLIEDTGNNFSLVKEEVKVIPAIDNVEDLMFLAAQAFDNNESWYIDVLPAALIKLQHQLTGSALAQLQPALQRALQTTKTGLRSTTGYYDHMLSIFFIDVCIILVRKFPKETEELNDVFEKFNQQDGDTLRKWMSIDSATSYIVEWDNYYKDPFYVPYKIFLTEVLAKIRVGDKLPLLSTPTHQPGWILPEILVQRVAEYQDKDLYPDPMDAKLALARCYLKNPEAGLLLAKEKLKGEWRNLFLFLLGENEVPQGPFTQPEAWVMASLSKSPKKIYPEFEEFGYYEKGLGLYTGQLPWEVVFEEYQTRRYDYKLGKEVPVTASHKILKINFKPQLQSKKEVTGVKGFLQKLTKKMIAKEPPQLLYNYFKIKAQYYSNEHNDIRRALLMAPNNTESLLPQLLSISFKYPTFTGENDKRMIIAALQVLYELWDEPGETAHLFLAASLLSSDKTAASTAAEIWVHHSPKGKIDNVLLGQIIGKYQRIEFAPFKRLTDLLIQSMINVSAGHNKMLRQIIESCLVELPTVPVKGLKKLLEIYAELLASDNPALINAEVRSQLEKWKDNPGLSRIIAGLINR